MVMSRIPAHYKGKVGRAFYGPMFSTFEVSASCMEQATSTALFESYFSFPLFGSLCSGSHLRHMSSVLRNGGAGSESMQG